MKTLTIRDHYALAALNGLLARDVFSEENGFSYDMNSLDCKVLASDVEKVVDAMLEAREERMKDE